MQFGITLKPDISIERIVGLTQQAERRGFEYGWIFDSHVLWIEAYPLMTLMATNTERMRIGTVRDQSGDARPDRDRELVRDAESDFGRAHGTRHRARRLVAARDGQEAGELVATGSGGEGISQPDFRQRSGARRPADAADVGEGFSAGVDRGLRAESSAHGGARG